MEQEQQLCLPLRYNRREELEYKLLYEKTYASGSTDSYESSVKAIHDNEAIKYAHEKLVRIDMLARWDTNITDALLIEPTGRKLWIPDYSRKWREEKERDKEK